MAHSLSLPEWAVLGVLLLRDRQFGEMRLTNSQLEDATGLCETSLRKARKRLVERGLISFVVSRDGATYTLHTEGQDNGKQEAVKAADSRPGMGGHKPASQHQPVEATRSNHDSQDEPASKRHTGADERAIIAHFKGAFPTAGIGQGSAGALLQAARGERQAVIEAIDKAVAGSPKAPLPYVKAVLGRMMEEKSVVEPEPEPESHATKLANMLNESFKSNPVKWA